VCFRIFIAAIFIASAPTLASAQSTISGIVRDASGGVLPGVSVEAASAALIEKTRTVVSDDQGRYSVVDLRPGVYKVTFTLQGFATFVRDGIDLPANFTATVNAELRVGALEESITVTGDAPLVDVQNAQRTAVLKRDLIDAVPTGRTYAQLGLLALGVKPSAQAVGGARTATQQRLLAHGQVPKDNTVAIDGMKMNSMYLGGETQANHNDAMVQEATVQTTSFGAEISAGGVVVNLIPREGGNTFSGAFFAGYTGSSFQGSNLTPELEARGLRQGDAVDYVYDVNWFIGGPIKRDKLWFFGSHRDVGNANVVANSFYPDGRPGLYDQRLYQFTVRLTSQLTPRNKFSAFLDRPIKNVPHDYASGTEVSAASRRRTDVLYYTTSLKWSSTVTNRLMFEAAWGGMANAINFIYQPGIAKERGTPEWYATASRQDIVLSTRTVAAQPEQHDYPFIYMTQASATYVTGSHSLKSGFQWRYGPYWRDYHANADLVQRYSSGAPDSVQVYNTPTHPSYRLNADLGFYVQDSWKIKQLTINPGIRFEYFNSQIDARSIEPGRFIGFRQFAEVKDLPNWFDVAPRFSAVYDLTGDARTALKFSLNKYNLNDTTDFAARYDAASLQNDIRNWRDCDYLPGTSTCSTRVLPTNGDNIAQDNEIGPSNNSRFGAAPARRPDPEIQRVYNLEYSVGVDRQLMSMLAVGASWYRRSWYNLEWQDNLLVTPNDYLPFQVTSPLNGENITVYNLDRNKQGQVDTLDRNSRDRSQMRRNYDGIELNFSARLPKGGSVFGGLSTERTVEVNCELENPNFASDPATTSPRSFRFCDQSALGMPFRTDFKLAGAYPLPLDLQVGTAFASYAGDPLRVTWSVPANLFPGGRTQSVTIDLIPPGTKYLERWNQVDLSLRKIFRTGRTTFDVALDMFNALNSNVVLGETQAFGAALGNPTAILQPRLLRLSGNVKF
jgi:hypothetical protein